MKMDDGMAADPSPGDPLHSLNVRLKQITVYHYVELIKANVLVVLWITCDSL